MKSSKSVIEREQISSSGGWLAAGADRALHSGVMARPSWNESYASGELPWDTGEPEPLLVEFATAGRVRPTRTLEIGAGTGTNAIWLAEREFEVLGIDVAPLAVEQANAKLEGRALRCRLAALDFLSAAPPGGPFEFVFDRGCFHVFDEPEELPTRHSSLATAFGRDRMISAAHIVIYSKNPDADRAFFRDVLGFPSVDAGRGWLIFALPPGEAAFHPSDESSTHELYFICDDLRAEMASLAQKGVQCSQVQEARWGSITKMQLPGGGTVGLYEPKHPLAVGLKAQVQ